MEKSYPIKIWSGLLSDGHTQKIENSLWEFIWLINKVTKEENGIGYVLKGKPVKVREIAEGLKRNHRSVLRHLEKLKKAGYINLKRCPYGFIFTINNSKKFQERVYKNVQSENRESVQKCPRECTKMSERVYKNVSNKLRYKSDINLDNKPPKKQKGGIKKIFNKESIEYGLSFYLFEKIKKNNSESKEPNFQKWARDMDLMIRIDSRDPEKIKQIINWSQKNDFWLKVILSPSNLRKNYDRLEIQRGERRGGNNNGRKKLDNERDYTEKEMARIEKGVFG